MREKTQFRSFVYMVFTDETAITDLPQLPLPQVQNWRSAGLVEIMFLSRGSQASIPNLAGRLS